MSKKKEITLAEFKAMTEDQKLELSAFDVARLTEENRKEEQDKADAAQAEVIKEKYKQRLAGRSPYALRVGEALAWLCPMDRKIVSMVAMTAGGDPVEAAELVLENCWLEGDERIKHDDEYFFGAMTQLKELRAAKLADIKKL